MAHQENAGASAPFAASAELLKTSPRGLIICATEWIDSAKNHFDYEKGHPGLQAAAQALMAAPEIFVGAEGPSWHDSQRSEFWSKLFAAKAQGAVHFDLLAALKPLDKKQLALGAKEMMISAARAKDAQSFEALLSLGAARRSKLVLFSAYQNGGKSVAEKVKAPTAPEAVELIKLGSRTGWRSSRDVVHDAEGIDWLLSKVDRIWTSDLAKVAAATPDHEFMLGVLEKRADKLRLAVDATPNPIIGKAKADAVQQGLEMAMQFASAGAPQTAKVCAKLVARELGMDFDAFWKQACLQGATASCNLSYPHVEEAKNAYRANFATAGNFQAPLTMQAACALSGDEEACAWLRQEMESHGWAWQPAQKLRQIYATMATGNQYQDRGLVELVGRAIAASERSELFGASAPKAPKSVRPRAHSL